MLAELHVSGRAPGSRKIEAARCEGLTEALAVTIAMVLDQDARESGVEANTQNTVAASEHTPSSSSTASASSSQTKVDSAGNTASNPAQHANAVANAPAAANAPATAPAVANASVRTNAPTANLPAAANATPAPLPPASATPAAEPPSVVPAASTTPPGSADQASLAGSSAAAVTPDQDIRAWLGAGAGSSNRWHFEIGGEYGVQRWALQLGAFFEPFHEQALGTGKLQILSGGGLAAGCRRFGTEFRFAPCVRASLGMERVNGEGFDQERVHTLPVATLGPVLGVETGRKWILGLDLLGEFVLTPRIYRLDNYVERRTQSVDSPRFVLWLVARVALSSGT